MENHTNIENLLPQKFIISREDLFSYEWEFARIKESFEYVKKNFSSNIVILIIIRNPYDYLNSIYAKSIQELKIINPENFFYLNKNQNQIRFKNKFNLYNFNYEKLIRLYKSYFKKVIVVKYEDIHRFEFLKEIYDIDEQFISILKKKNKVYNKSISSFGIKLILFLNRYLNVEMQQKSLKGLLSTKNRSFQNKIVKLF